ncbi:unnamed protein product [Choristocarpus tenellus]
MEERSDQGLHQSYGSIAMGESVAPSSSRVQPAVGENLTADGVRPSRRNPYLKVLSGLGLMALYAALAFSLQNGTSRPGLEVNPVKDNMKGAKGSSWENGVLAEDIQLQQHDTPKSPRFQDELSNSPGKGTKGVWDTSPSSTELFVHARNEYGASDPVALALYGYELLVEPYRETTLSVEFSDSVTAVMRESHPYFHWYLALADDDGSVIDGVEPELDGEYGAEVLVTLKDPGSVYRLTVSEVFSDKSGGFRRTDVAQVPTSVSLLVTCKYVRRELRQLTDQDLDDFMHAMSVFYDVAESDSPANYGPDFITAKDMVALHSSLLQLNGTN